MEYVINFVDKYSSGKKLLNIQRKHMFFTVAVVGNCYLNNFVKKKSFIIIINYTNMLNFKRAKMFARHRTSFL